MHGFVGGSHVYLVEGRGVDSVPVDFSDVEEFFGRGDVRGGDAVRGSPHFGRGGGVLEG